MRCWNCTQEVPETPFCRNCGAALPDPATRQAAITQRLAEITAERSVLEAQLQRITGVAAPTVASPTPTAPSTPLSATPSASTQTERPAVIISRPAPSTPARAPLFNVDLSPATIVTLVGVVLLAAASLVSAKENPALISLSHSTRMIVLIVESLVAAAATVILATKRKTLADAFGALAWSAALSLGLLATVNISDGSRPDIWTYTLPFFVGALIVTLARRHLDLTRFVGCGTLAFGVVHLAYFGLNPNINGYQFATEVTMARGVIVMTLISLAASAGLWAAFSPRLENITRAERYLAFLTVGLLLLFSLSAPLPLVTSGTSGLLAFIGEMSIAVPFGVAAVALHRRGRHPASAIFGIAGGLLALVFLAYALLGHVSFVTTFPGSHAMTLVFPVVFSAIAFALAFAAYKVRSYATILWVLAAASLIPSLGAVAATFRWELVGGLGSDAVVPIGQISPWSSGWFGRGVTIGDVSPITIALSGLSLVTVIFITSRTAPRDELQRALRQATGLVGVLSALAVAMRFTDPAISTVITAISLTTVGCGAFLASRFVRTQAPLDEWPPFVLLGGGLLASLFRNAAFTGHATEWRPGGITMVSLGLIVVAGALSATRRRDSWHAFVGWAVITPALGGIYSIHHNPRLAWQVAIVTIGSAFLVQGLATRQREQGGLEAYASSGLLVGGVYAYVSQIGSMVSLDYRFRAAAVLLALALTFAVAQRRGASLRGVAAIAPATLAGVVWAAMYHDFYAPGAWLIGGAVALLALNWNQDKPDHASWNEWGPSLALTMIPANYGALTGSSFSAACAIGAAVVLVIIGVQLKKRAVFDVAVATFALLSIARLTQVVSDQGRWVVAVIVGVVLIGNGFWRETRKESATHDDASATSWYRSLT